MLLATASETEIYRQIGRLLQNRRKKIDLRQADIAKTLSLPQSAISKIETGERKIELLEASDICDAYQIELSELISIIRTKA